MNLKRDDISSKEKKKRGGNKASREEMKQWEDEMMKRGIKKRENKRKVVEFDQWYAFTNVLNSYEIKGRLAVGNERNMEDDRHTTI